MRAKMILATAAGAAMASSTLATTVITNQQPVSGGGVSRWSQQWQDPGPNGNNLDGDSVCWTDFTLAAPTSINHLEWWGVGACELGFQVEFWPQDPGTVAYQPLGVFYYGGSDNGVQPTAAFRTTAYTVTPGPGGINNYTLDLASPVALPGNTAANPRWFIAVIGLTHQAYATWSWSQGTGGSNRSYQFVRGLPFRSLGEGRALLITSINCTADFNASGSVTVQDIFDFLAAYFAGSPAADVNHSGGVGVQDVFDYLASYFAGC